MRRVLCGLRRHAVLVDVAIAVFFVVLDTAVTLTAARGGRRVRTGSRGACWWRRGSSTCR